MPLKRKTITAGIATGITADGISVPIITMTGAGIAAGTGAGIVAAIIAGVDTIAAAGPNGVTTIAFAAAGNRHPTGGRCTASRSGP